MSEMNGAQADNEAPAIMMSNPVITLLENTLAAVKAGQIDSIAIITVSPQGAVTPIGAGARYGDLYVGCAQMQATIMDFIRAPKSQSRIIRAMPG